MVLKLLLSMARDMGKTITIVTHNQNIAKMADTVIRVKNGRIEDCRNQDHHELALFQRQIHMPERPLLVLPVPVHPGNILKIHDRHTASLP